MNKYKVIRGSFSGLVFKGQLYKTKKGNAEKYEDRVENTEKFGQSFPVENCEEVNDL